MSGQMIAGISPVLAIKYQIAVMIEVYVTTVTCVALSKVLTSLINFDEYGLLKKVIFKILHIVKQ
ncbi:MAG: ABC transporter permease [Methanohalobium sp.]|uniref:ABC transporter permease n=1 Tax=Methanohalobium sp. TaxID=2837493 RepID=UPI003978F943